jgi:hypothetical protein
MLSQQSIDSLKSRIGFGKPLEESFPFDLGDDLTIGTSGLTVAFFHSLATVENLHACLPQVYELETDKEAFENYLDNLRIQAVTNSINELVYSNKGYNPDSDYNDLVMKNISVFDSVIGYQLACLLLETFMVTNRSNIHERNAKLSIANLKLEVNGWRNEQGILVQAGLGTHLKKAQLKASRKLFPLTHIIQNASDKW